LSDSPYGTFDQGGNVSEWNETAVTSSTRGLRGGSFFEFSSSSAPLAAYRSESDPTTEDYAVGFRVASIAVPEPSTVLLLTIVFAFAIRTAYRGKPISHNRSKRVKSKTGQNGSVENLDP
jgi:PEP-CTERM motif